jgi:hypothetical protein
MNLRAGQHARERRQLHSHAHENDTSIWPTIAGDSLQNAPQRGKGRLFCPSPACFIRGTFRLQYDGPFWNAPVLRFPVFDGGDLEMIIIVFLELFDDRDYHKRSNR